MIEALIGIILVAAVVIFFVAYDALAWGLVCWKFWYWFVLPVFPTLPEIAFWQAVGLMFFISLFKNTTQQVIKEEYRDNSTQMIMTFIVPWLALLMGYIVHALVIPKFM
jgi:hypothetical protein